MINTPLKKSLVFGIILLFVGVTVVQSINANMPISDNMASGTGASNFTADLGTLSGYVTDSMMNPIEGARVRVYFHNTSRENYSDANGYFHVADISICNCTKNATCSKGGYNPAWVYLTIWENTTCDFVLTSKGDWLYVGGNGPGNYSKIQDAINDASNGDTVFVYDDSSPYYENIILEKSIILIGEDRATTVILGDESSDNIIVNISADDVSISGLTIEPNIGQPTGIAVYKNYTSPDFWNMEVIQNVTIFNNNIKNIGWGIFGIRLEQGNIYGNNIENCDGYGIYLLVSSNTAITNNFITDCSVDGIIIDGLWSQFSIIMNYRNPKPENNIISQNTIMSNQWGIEVNSGPVNTKIYENNIIGNHELGIYIVFAYKTEITRNNFIENSQNAYFMAIQFTQLLKNSWDKNYWGEPKNIPVTIPGSFYLIPLKVFDRHPAQEPYDIP